MAFLKKGSEFYIAAQNNDQKLIYVILFEYYRKIVKVNAE